MSENSEEFTAVPFSRMRQLVLDAGWMGQRRQPASHSDLRSW